MVTTISRGLLVSISIDELDTDLLGESKLNLLASRSSQLGDTLLDRLSVVLNLGHSDAPLLREIFTADTGKGDGLVHAGLDGLRVGNSDRNINRVHNRHVVGSLLLDLLAVVVAIASMAIAVVSITTITGLTDSDHLDVGLLLEADLNSLGSGVLLLLLVGVRADLVVDLLNGLGADSAGHGVAELNINNALDGKVDILADSLEGGGADLSQLSHILNRAVVLGVLIAIVGLGVMVGRLMMVVRGGRLVVDWLGLVGGGGRLGGIGHSLVLVVSSVAMLVTVASSKARERGEGALVGKGQGKECEKNKSLQVSK